MGLSGLYGMREGEDILLDESEHSNGPVVRIGTPTRMLDGKVLLTGSFPIFLHEQGLPKLKAAIRKFEEERGREASIATAREVARKRKAGGTEDNCECGPVRAMPGPPGGHDRHGQWLPRTRGDRPS